MIMDTCLPSVNHAEGKAFTGPLLARSRHFLAFSLRTAPDSS